MLGLSILKYFAFKLFIIFILFLRTKDHMRRRQWVQQAVIPQAGQKTVSLGKIFWNNDRNFEQKGCNNIYSPLHLTSSYALAEG